MGSSWQCDIQFCISTASKNQLLSGSQYLHENTPHIKSVLLAGPENSGKTMLVRNIFLSCCTLYCYSESRLMLSLVNVISRLMWLRFEIPFTIASYRTDKQVSTNTLAFLRALPRPILIEKLTVWLSTHSYINWFLHLNYNIEL